MKHLPHVGFKFLGWGWAYSSLVPRTCFIILITLIFNLFDDLYLFIIVAKTKYFPRLQVISKFVSLIPLCWKMVCLQARSIKDKCKCIQEPTSRFYLCRMYCWQKIDSIYTPLQVVIYFVGGRRWFWHCHSWLTIQLHSSYHFFIKVRKKHDFLFFVINMHHDRPFLSFSNWL